MLCCSRPRFSGLRPCRLRRLGVLLLALGSTACGGSGGGGGGPAVAAVLLGVPAGIHVGPYTGPAQPIVVGSPDETLGASEMWSPDGRWLAFWQRTNGLDELVVYAPAEGTRKVLTAGLASLVEGGRTRWSEVGAKIAFLWTATSGSLLLSIVDVETGVIETPTVSLALPGSIITFIGVAWQPGGTALAFGHDVDGGERGLYVYDGGLVTRISPATRHVVNSRGDVVAWSPDGTLLLFRCAPSSGPGQPSNQLFVAPPGQQVISPRVALAPPKEIEAPVWSPAGEYIAYAADAVTADDDEIFVIKPLVGPPTQLSVSELFSSEQVSPRWTGDGARVVYASESAFNGASIHAGDPVSGTSDLVAQLGLTDELRSFVSAPVGDRIAYSYMDDDSHIHVRTVRSDGTGNVEWPLLDVSEDANLRWSPDGRFAALIFGIKR